MTLGSIKIGGSLKTQAALSFLFIPKLLLSDDINDDVKESVTTALDRLKERGATWEPFSFGHFDDALSAYYILAPAEASANLERYDGVRYGHRDSDADYLRAMYKKTRGHGFGPEGNAVGTPPAPSQPTSAARENGGSAAAAHCVDGSGAAAGESAPRKRSAAARIAQRRARGRSADDGGTRAALLGSLPCARARWDPATQARRPRPKPPRISSDSQSEENIARRSPLWGGRLSARAAP